REVRLGVALVLALELLGKRDVLDQSLVADLRERERRLSVGAAARVDRGDGDVVEALRLARPEVEDARELGMIEEMQVDLGHVLHRHEVALLLAGTVAARALEQAHALVGAVLPEQLPCHRHHAGRLLVRLPRAVHVEVAKARDLRVGLGQAPAHHRVEEQLGIAVDVERRLERRVLAEGRARAVDRGRRRVDQRHLLLEAEVEQRERAAVVVLHHVAPVGLGGDGARALVEDRVDRALEIAARQALEKIPLVEEVGDRAVDQVAVLVAPGQIVDRDDVGLAARVQRAHEVRADEAGGSGHDVVAHDSAAISSSGRTTVAPNLVTFTPAAELAMRIASSSGVPTASITPSVAMSVSPAPLTSETSCTLAGSCSIESAWNSVMPFSPRVTSSAPSLSFARSARALSASSASSAQGPTTCASSSRLGVTTLAPS